MRILELLTEAREAPLYHFTLEPRFFKILSTDTLVAGRGNRIYFTRDYRRQFAPGNIMAGTWGFRINQGLLHQRYGKRLQAGGQSQWSEKERQAWLADPKNAQDIERAKSDTSKSSLTINGVDIKNAIKGTTGQAARWESEEHLMVDQLPNFHEYITGIVYAGGKAIDPGRTTVGGKRVRTDIRSANPQDSMDELATLLMGHFKDFAQRDALIEYMTKFNIPFVYQQQDFPAKAVKQRMIDKWRQRKAEREQNAAGPQASWLVIRNAQGGGITFSGPDNMWKAAQAALKSYPHKLPSGIFGMQKMTDKKITWFTKVYKDPKILPDVDMGGLAGAPTDKQISQTV